MNDHVFQNFLLFLLYLNVLLIFSLLIYILFVNYLIRWNIVSLLATLVGLILSRSLMCVFRVLTVMGLRIFLRSRWRLLWTVVRLVFFRSHPMLSLWSGLGKISCLFLIDRLNIVMLTFFCCYSCMMSFRFLIFLPNKLSFPKISSLIMRNKINRNLLMIRGSFLLILLNTSFNNNIHKIFNIPFFIYLLSILNNNKLTMIINSNSFF